MEKLTKKEILDLKGLDQFMVLYHEENKPDICRMQHRDLADNNPFFLFWDNMTEGAEDCEQLVSQINEDGSFTPTYGCEAEPAQFYKLDKHNYLIY